MEFTGERVVPGLVEPDLLNEHLARYIFAETFIPGKRVLDAGCGSGYGAERLAAKARWVVAVDNSAEAIGYAREHYRRPNLFFLYGDCERIPVASEQFDVIVSFEVIEHLEHPEQFLKEVRRVLRPAGLFVLSTPNRVYYTEERQETNPFHHREYNREEFARELGQHFSHVKLLAQSHAASVVMAPLDGSGTAPETVLERAPQPDDEPHYFLGVCSARPLPAKLHALCYVPAAANVLREREQHIHRLNQEVAELKKIAQWAQQIDKELKDREQALGALQREYDERTSWALQLDQELKAREQTVSNLQKDYDERTAWALRLDKELKEREQALVKLQAEFEERTAWALKLDAELKSTQEELRGTQEQIARIKQTRAYRLAKFLRLV